MNPFAFERLMHPWWLAALPLIIIVLGAECLAGFPAAMNLSTGHVALRLRRGLRARLRLVPPVFRAAGLALLMVALARPQDGVRLRPETVPVVDILLCVDVSGSMRAMDFVEDGEHRDRLYVTKLAVRDFIENRRKAGDGRFGSDRLGLVLYAGYAWTQCPLTLDYSVLERELEAARIADRDRSKSGTAIGSAIGLCVSKLRRSEAESKVVVLLTDGRNNAGPIDPATAAAIAWDYGIRIYTIGAGSEGPSAVRRDTPRGTEIQAVRIPMDAAALHQIAEITGGKFFRAHDTEALKEAYAEIDELETTEIEVNMHYEYEEAFMPWAAAGLGLVCASVFSRRLWFETAP